VVVVRSGSEPRLMRAPASRAKRKLKACHAQAWQGVQA